MLEHEDLRQLDTIYPDRYFLIHDGYCPWAYGMPMHPTKVPISAALYLLHQIEGETKDELLNAVRNPDPPPLQYAERGDRLYIETGGNRFLTFQDPDLCVTEQDNFPL